VEPKLAEAGLVDVVGCDSLICFIDGVNDRPFYRGYDALILAETIISEKHANKIKISGFVHRHYSCEDRKIKPNKPVPTIFITAIVKKVPGKKNYQLPQTKAC